MTVSLDINESAIFTVLRAFLVSILPPNVPVIRGQANRVPEPSNSDFVEMTPLFQERLATNIDSDDITTFSGSINGMVLTAATIYLGSLAVGSTVYGAGVAANTTITKFLTGIGQAGTYAVSVSQTVTNEPMQASTKSAQQYTQVTVQLDVHGPSSADNTQIITTLFRDDYACEIFSASGFDMAPLYTSEPRQTPFINGEQQYEERWTIDAVMEVNPTVVVPQQVATSLGPVNIFDVV